MMEIWQSIEEWHFVFYLAIPVFVWLIRVPAGKLLLRLLRVFLKGIGLKLGENLQESMLPALQVLVVSFGVLIANEQLAPPEPYFTLIHNLLISASVAAVFSVAFTMCVFIPQLVQRNPRVSIRQQSTFLLRLSKFTVIFLGIAAIMKVWGVDIGPALTGMGVAGAAVALAAQDSVKNLLGGLNNAAERRFDEGDLIRVEGVVEGYVESVDLRSTKIRRLDTAPVHVPNADLANCAVINFGQRPHRRIYWNVGLTYSTPNTVVRTIRDRVEKFIDECGYFEPAETTGRYVHVNGLGDSSIDLLVHCFTRSTEYIDFLEAREALTLAILEIVEEEGSEIAFPSRSIYMSMPVDDLRPGEKPC